MPLLQRRTSVVLGKVIYSLQRAIPRCSFAAGEQTLLSAVFKSCQHQHPQALLPNLSQAPGGMSFKQPASNSQHCPAANKPKQGMEKCLQRQPAARHRDGWPKLEVPVSLLLQTLTFAGTGTALRGAGRQVCWIWQDPQEGTRWIRAKSLPCPVSKHRRRQMLGSFSVSHARKWRKVLTNMTENAWLPRSSKGSIELKKAHPNPQTNLQATTAAILQPTLIYLLTGLLAGHVLVALHGHPRHLLLQHLSCSWISSSSFPFGKTKQARVPFSLPQLEEP